MKWNGLFDVTLLPVFFMVLISPTSTHWWSLANDRSIQRLGDGLLPVSVCDDVDGLSRNQKALCKRYHNHMSFVSQGAQAGIQECQHQFRSHRWNCSTVDDSSVFGKVLKIGSKEMAFAYAIAAAGVVHSVSRACKTATLTTCGCGETTRPDGLHPHWNWGGCGDNTDYAYGFAREFIDARERDNISPRNQRDRARKAMNLHNNEAGRMAVIQGTRAACKCHGVSGSCSLKTCWFQVPTFREIGDKLLEEHEKAMEMRVNGRGQIKPRQAGKGKPVVTDLVYLEASPDYCKVNAKTGVRGTLGRECNKNSTRADGCGLLCCGRGYVSKEVEIIEPCNCKFQWCCTVRCQKCRIVVTKYMCK